jgi:hypothetical protein
VSEPLTPEMMRRAYDRMREEYEQGLDPQPIVLSPSEFETAIKGARCRCGETAPPKASVLGYVYADCPGCGRAWTLLRGRWLAFTLEGVVTE